MSFGVSRCHVHHVTCAGLSEYTRSCRQLTARPRKRNLDHLHGIKVREDIADKLGELQKTTDSQARTTNIELESSSEPRCERAIMEHSENYEAREEMARVGGYQSHR